jgi:hypothetical protein
MKPNKYKEKQREILKLSKRINEIYDEMRNAPYVDVEPFQHGWNIQVVVKHNTIKHESLKEAIDLGFRNYKTFYNPKSIRDIRKGILFYTEISNIRGTYIPNQIPYSEEQYLKLPENVRKFFHLEKVNADRNIFAYIIRYDERFMKLKVTKNIVCRIQEINPDLISELAFIKQRLMKKCPNYFGKYRRDYNLNIRQDGKRQIKKFIGGLIDEINNKNYVLH